jgi:chromosome segregation ATPase
LRSSETCVSPVVSLPFCVSFPPCYRSLPNAKTKQGNYASTSQNSKPIPMTSMRSLKLHLRISSKKQKTKMPSSVLRTRRLNTLASKCMPLKRMRIVWVRSTNVSERRKQQSAKHWKHLLLHSRTCVHSPLHLPSALTQCTQKVSGLKSELQDLQESYDQSFQDIHVHRARQEELAGHVEDLVNEVKREQEARESLEREFDDAEKTHESELRHERRALEDKESALRSTLDDLSRTQSLLSQRESDLEAVQSVLRDMEQRSKEIGETHTTARFSLQLEVDRLKRDVDRLEDELVRARKDVGDREGTTRDREDLIHKLQLEVQQLTAQLNTQTQARLGISEKLDSTQSNLKATEAELFGYRTKVNELETRLSKDQRSLLNAENQYRDQLTERNTLLLTIYQYMDKILGVDKTPV